MLDHLNNSELRKLLQEHGLSEALRQRVTDELAKRHKLGAGQIAYEEDCRREPNYPNGTPRPAWSELDYIAQQSWNIFPIVRAKEKI